MSPVQLRRNGLLLAFLVVPKGLGEPAQDLGRRLEHSLHSGLVDLAYVLAQMVAQRLETFDASLCVRHCAGFVLFGHSAPSSFVASQAEMGSAEAHAPPQGTYAPRA